MRVVKESSILNHILQNILLCKNSQFYPKNLYKFLFYFAVKILTFVDMYANLLKLRFMFFPDDLGASPTSKV